jgi:hypothetical protein
MICAWGEGVVSWAAAPKDGRSSGDTKTMIESKRRIAILKFNMEVNGGQSNRINFVIVQRI